MNIVNYTKNMRTHRLTAEPTVWLKTGKYFSVSSGSRRTNAFLMPEYIWLHFSYRPVCRPLREWVGWTEFNILYSIEAHIIRRRAQAHTSSVIGYYHSSFNFFFSSIEQQCTAFEMKLMTRGFKRVNGKNIKQLQLSWWNSFRKPWGLSSPFFFHYFSSDSMCLIALVIFHSVCGVANAGLEHNIRTAAVVSHFQLSDCLIVCPRLSVEIKSIALSRGKIGLFAGCHHPTKLSLHKP